MKIVHVLNHFLPDQIAGTEVYVWALCKQLLSKGYESMVLIPNFGKTEDEITIYDGIKVYRYAEHSIKSRALIQGFKLPDGMMAFKKALINEQCHIVHFHEISYGNGIVYPYTEIAKQVGAKVIMTFHLAGYSCRTGTLMYKSHIQCNGVIEVNRCSECYLHSKGYSRMIPFLLSFATLSDMLNLNTLTWNNKVGTALATKYLLRKLRQDLFSLVENLDQFVTITNWYKEILIKNGIPEKKICYIPQALPTNKPLRQWHDELDNANVLRLVFVGRISPFKGLHLLIDALSTIPHDKISLDIFGQSSEMEYENELRQKTAKLPNVSWRGKLAQQEVVNTLARYDMLCLCSTFSEMSPLVIQEAFAAGIPVLASNVYGNAEQITHNVNGLLFRFNDTQSLREMIHYCLEKPEVVDKLKQGVKKPADFSRVGDAYEKLYHSLLEVTLN